MDTDKKPEVTYLTAARWHLAIEMNKNLAIAELKELNRAILKLQLQAMRVNEKFTEIDRLERGANIAEESGMRMEYYLEGDSLCYSAQDKGGMGFVAIKEEEEEE